MDARVVAKLARLSSSSSSNVFIHEIRLKVKHRFAQQIAETSVRPVVSFSASLSAVRLSRGRPRWHLRVIHSGKLSKAPATRNIDFLIEYIFRRDDRTRPRHVCNAHFPAHKSLVMMTVWYDTELSSCACLRGEKVKRISKCFRTLIKYIEFVYIV